MQCTTAAILFGTGDVIAQQGVEKRGLARHDVWRASYYEAWETQCPSSSSCGQPDWLSTGVSILWFLIVCLTDTGREGALFGPLMTHWYAFLNRLKFPTPTKAVIYRVRLIYQCVEFVFITKLLGLSWSGCPYTRSAPPCLNLPHSTLKTDTIYLAAVAFFYGSMSVLELKPNEAFDRIKSVGAMSYCNGLYSSTFS